MVEIVCLSLKDFEKGMWGFVNNVGIFMFGEVEFISMEIYKEVVEVNFWGIVWIMKFFFFFI